MPTSNPVLKPILGSFEDIGEQVVSQIKSIPGDIAGRAMESLGASTGVKGQKTQQTPQPSAAQDAGSTWQQLEKTPDEGIKREMARKALEELTRPSTKPKQPSVWERMMQEEEQKKQAKEQQLKADETALPTASAKRARGDLYGIKAKRQGSEIGKNVKHD